MMELSSPSLARSSSWLDWRQRPSDLSQKIADHFSKATLQEFNREPTVESALRERDAAGLDSYLLMKTIMKEASPQRRQFYVLGIGKEHVTWSEGLRCYLLTEQALFPNAHVKIIVISPEKASLPLSFIESKKDHSPYLLAKAMRSHQERFKKGEINEVSYEKKGSFSCDVEYWDQFNLEELNSSLKARGLDEQTHFDLMIAGDTFQKMVDSLGSFAQVYHRLTPQGGFLLTRGFSFNLLKQKRIVKKERSVDLTRLLFVSIPHLLVYPYHLPRSRADQLHYIVRRWDEASCRFPLNYVSSYFVERESKVEALFQVTQKRFQGLLFRGHTCEVDGLQGDKKLYEWFKQKGVCYYPWTPFWEEESLDFPLHQAIQQKEYDQAIHLVDLRAGINDSDIEGNTPLHLLMQSLRLEEHHLTHLQFDLSSTHHSSLRQKESLSESDLATQKNAHKLLERLLEKRATINLPNNKGKIPLHLAAKYDREGSILLRLIQHGGDLSGRTESRALYRKMPIDVAKKFNNGMAIKYLLEAQERAHSPSPTDS